MRYEYEKLPEPQIPNTLANLAGQTVGPQQTQNLPSDTNTRAGFVSPRQTGDGKTSFARSASTRTNHQFEHHHASATRALPIHADILAFSDGCRRSVFPNVFTSAQNTLRPASLSSERMATRRS